MEDDLVKLYWLDVKKRITFKILLLAHKAIIGLAPVYIQDMFQYAHHGHTLKLLVPSFHTQIGGRSFSAIAPKLYNNTPMEITSAPTLDSFKSRLKTYLFKQSSYEIEKLYH